MKKVILAFQLVFFSHFIFSQIPSYRLTDWTKAGLLNPIYNQKNKVTIESFGGKALAHYSNDTAIRNAINFLKWNGGGTILFGSGTYLFNNAIFLSDSITLKGNGKNTIIQFNLNKKVQNCIQIIRFNNTTNFNFESANRGDYSIKLIDGKMPPKNSIIKLVQNDSALAFSNWAVGNIGQICKVKNIDSINKIMFLETPLRLSFKKDKNTFFQILSPIQNVSIECLTIQRVDTSNGQSDIINFLGAFNCRVKGVETINCNFAHINFEYSIHNEVTQSYMHHAFAYGGGGQGYGVVMQATSSENKVENNIFEHLRHSVLMQSGANGNVIGYNYSWDTYWESFPTNSAGDLVCHGNYAHSNLFEGNICQNIVVDNSHGKNGPYNTFFRNRAELYGIVTNSQDSQNYIGNEITNTSLFMGQYILGGVGNLAIKNNIKGTLQSSSLLVNQSSLYLTNKPNFFNENEPFPVFGFPVAFNTNKLAAKERNFLSNEKILCNTFSTNQKDIKVLNTKDFKVFPNPFFTQLKIECNEKIQSVHLFNVEGKEINVEIENNTINVSYLTNGIYLLKVNNFPPHIVVKN